MAAKIQTPAELLRELKSSTSYASVYLLAGPDSFRIERTARWLREKAIDPSMADFNVQTLFAEDCSPAQIAEAARAYPMFGERRCVWVRHAENLSTGSAIEPLLDYLKLPNESTLLLLSSNKLDKRLKLTTACAESGRCVEFAHLSGAELSAQLQRQGREYGIELSGDAAQLLCELVGEDLGELDNELAKLALQDDAEGRRIEADEVRELVARSRDVDAFALADALDPRAPLRALELWMDLRRGGGDVLGAAAILGWRLRQLAQFAAALDETGSEERASKLVGLAPWQARRLVGLARAFADGRAERSLAAWRQADRRAKSASLGAELAYDLAVLEWAVSP